MNRWFALLSFLWCIPAPGAAQDTTAGARPDTTVAARSVPSVTLSLEDALQQARANSPTYRQTLNDAGPAKWAVRNAYGNLLPQLHASSDFGYTGSGESNFGGGFVRPTSAFVTSGYNLGVFWQLNGRALSAPGQQKALQRSTDEDITGAGVALRGEIETQYLNTLQATAQVEVARQQVVRNADFLALAKARHQVGQATLLDVRQAEVDKGQSDFEVLRALQLENEAKLDLIRRMGVEPPVLVEQIGLSDSFPVTPLDVTLDSLMLLADAQNPVLRSLRARRTAAWWNVRAAKSDFLPTLSVQAGWGGFTQQFTDDDLLLGQSLTFAQSQASDCQYDNQIRSGLNLGGEVANCYAASGLVDGGSALLDPVTQQVLDANNTFPFHYTGLPFQANLRVSLPIFTGFGRSLRVSQAKAEEQDADEDTRARRLQVRSDVHGRFLGLQTAYQAIAVQSANRDAARDLLRLARDRYRLGAGTSLEVSDAQNAVQRAEGDYVNAVYYYHKAIVALEVAVGRSLR
jgi:outer membrane protein